MSSPSFQLTCAICNSITGYKVIAFVDKTLKKCNEVLNIRKLNHFKYEDVVLPYNTDTTRGYHTKCYKCFTAVSNKYYDRSKSGDENNILISTFLQEPSTSTQNVVSVKIEEMSEDVPYSPEPPAFEHNFNFKLEDVSEDFLFSPEPSTSTQNDVYVKMEEIDEDFSLSPNVLDIKTEEVQESAASCVDATPAKSSEEVCFFCEKRNKKQNGRVLPLHVGQRSTFENYIEKNVASPDDSDMTRKLENLTTTSVLYHNICKFSYFDKTRRPAKACATTSWHTHRNYHKHAYNELCAFIEENVSQKGRTYLLSYLYNYYITSVQRLAEKNSDSYNNLYTAQHLEMKIAKTFKRDVKVISMHRKRIVVPKCRDEFEPSCSFLEEADILQKAAFILRNNIAKIKRVKLAPRGATAEDLMRGECSVPRELHDFYLTLLGGSDRRLRESQDCDRKVKSLSQDLIYAVTEGKIKTSKHVTLGMCLKNLTNDRKVIDVVNRYGHCCTYKTIEEFETEAICSATTQSSICPEGVVMAPDLSTGVAFDNFGRYVDKDAPQYTVGILYQNDDVKPLIADDTRVKCNAKKRRDCDVDVPELISYLKKPRTTSNNQFSQSLPYNVEVIKKIDTIWMLCHATAIPNTPMWAGFNSKLVIENSPKQKIFHLAPTDASPRNVLETMRRSQKIADELKQRYMQVTYDLATAGVALRLQSTEKPMFDDLFVHLGTFHIMLAYFKALGKFISDCGLSNVMIESELLANDSVDGFVAGKHFNRCKRLHPLMSLGLEILHFEAFLAREKLQIGKNLISELMVFQSKKLQTPVVNENNALFGLLKKYAAHRESTVNGEFGKTAQFYMTYVNLVHHYLTLSRSIRMGDFALFKYSLPKIANLFFAFNQPNSARSLVIYHDNLTKVVETHPALMPHLLKGCFGVRRTEQNFSRQPIDLTLAQTMGADARTKKSHDVRSTVTSRVFEETRLSETEDVTSDLELCQIQRQSARLRNFTNALRKDGNPFDPDLDKDRLVNISTGRAASRPVEDFLLNVERLGNEAREAFASECATTADRFDKTIDRSDVLNFSADFAKRFVKIGNETREVRVQRHLFGRALDVCMRRTSNVAQILSYPLTPIPASMFHLDGSMRRTDKAVLVELLGNEIDGDALRHVDVVLLDGFSLIRTIKDVPETFGDVSKRILQAVTKIGAPRIDVVFDRHFSPSIRECGRSQIRHLGYVIAGPRQVRPTDFANELKNVDFKEALVNFLITHWATDEMAPFIGDKIINLNFRTCHTFETVDGTVVSTIDETLSCENHEEIGTKIVHHICNIDYHANVVIKCADADTLVILLGNMNHITTMSLLRIWIKNDPCYYIDVTKLHAELGESVSRSLPGFHAVTGCVYNPAFYRKDKKRAFELLKESTKYQRAFADLGESHTLSSRDKTFAVLEKFICEMYNVSGVLKVNEARFEIFNRTCTIKNANGSFRVAARNYDAANLPPCRAELVPHLLRAHYIANTWRNANLKVPTDLLPQNNGWTEKDGKYDFVWFEDDQLPTMPVSDAIELYSDQNDAVSEECEQSDDDVDDFEENDDCSE